MKHILIALAFVGVLFISSNVSAATCGQDAPCSNGNPGAVTMQWGYSGDLTPKVPAGGSTIDAAGHREACPFWFTAGCYDITKTEYYRAQQIATAKSLKVLGFTLTGRWLYWGQFVK